MPEWPKHSFPDSLRANKKPLDLDDPLARQLGESRNGNQAFRDYCMMGSKRSYKALLKRYVTMPAEEGTPPTRSKNTLKSWTSKFKWQQRLEAWIFQQQELVVVNWEARQLEISEIEWGRAHELLDRASQMLKFPLAEVKRVEEFYEDGRPHLTTIIKPVKWQQRDVVAFVETASKLMRLSTGSETARVRIDDWRSDLIALVAEGKITADQVRSDFPKEVASEILLEAGVDVEVKDV